MKSWNCSEDGSPAGILPYDEQRAALRLALEDTTTINPYYPELRWGTALGTYRALCMDDTLMMGDTVLTAHYDSCFAANIGKLDRASNGLNSGKDASSYLDTLNNMTTSITPEDAWRDVLVVAYEHMADTTMEADDLLSGLTTALDSIFPDSTFSTPYRKRQSWSSDHHTILEGIAEECPYEYGPAVHMARVMLSYYDTVPYLPVHTCEVMQEPPSGKWAQEEEEDDMDEQTRGIDSFLLYPNPNIGEFSILLNMQDAEKAQLWVWSVAGQQVHNDVLGNGMNTVRLHAAEGLYLYQVTVNNEPRWSGHKCLLILCMLILLGGELSAQQNLVPNPSFEEFNGCPDIPSEIWRATPWIKVGGGGIMTYYNSCGEECCDIPLNRLGSQDSRTGEGYANLALMHNNHALTFHVEGNFLGAPLLDTLIAGQRYLVEFYLSLADSCRFAGRNVGVHFSKGVPSHDVNDLLELEPQMRYDGDFLSDKENWMRVAGSFIADGMEDYITVGNFDGYFNSDTLNLHDGGVAPNTEFWELAAYYIDDVSLVEDSTWHVGVDGPLMMKDELSVYPNPSSGGSITVQYDLKNGEATELMVFDVVGRRMTSPSPSFQGGEPVQLDVSAWPSGIYVVQVVDGNGNVRSAKLVRE